MAEKQRGGGFGADDIQFTVTGRTSQECSDNAFKVAQRFYAVAEDKVWVSWQAHPTVEAFGVDEPVLWEAQCEAGRLA